jgi:predicted SnoaL-like aldol condensation-catalyzing enzyme
MSLKNKNIIKNFIEDIWNNNKIDLITTYIHPKYKAHRLKSMTTLRGINSVKKNIKDYKRKFPNLKIIIKDMISEGDKISSLITLINKNKKMQELIIHKIESNKIIESWSIGSD